MHVLESGIKSLDLLKRGTNLAIEEGRILRGIFSLRVDSKSKAVNLRIHSRTAHLGYSSLFTYIS